MNPPSKDHVEKVLREHRQFPGDYCAVSALEFASKAYGLLEPDKFPLQSISSNQQKGFDEQALQNLVLLSGHSNQYEIQSAVETIEKETSEGRCVSVSLRGFLIFGQIVIPLRYHIFISLWSDGQPILIDPATKQILARGKEDLTKLLQENSLANPERKTIHMEILQAQK
jgi:hypothetical protein